ncbi:hypothetical protein ACFLXB_06305 [Chloroflexota bacterium]
MKLRRITFLFCAVILLFSFSVPVKASPPLQGSQEDLIKQVLAAVKDQYGWNGTVTLDQTADNIPALMVGTYIEGYGIKIIHVIVADSAETAKSHLKRDWGYPGILRDLGGTLNSYTFHGYPAVSSSVCISYCASAAAFHVGPLYIETYDQGGGGAKNIMESFYSHAMTNGLIAGDLVVTPAVTETVIPAITTTPAPGSPIILRASADGYTETTQTIDNSTNFGSVDVSGFVSSLNTGAAVGGAIIEVISGASYGSTVSVADGSYSLTAIIPGGVDSGLVSGINFALPVLADLTIDVLPTQTELLADGTSSTDVLIQVKDLQGNPLKDRTFTLELGGATGPGTIQPAQASTDQNGTIQATYTSFKLSPGFDTSTTRHEVTVTARDDTTGVVGSNTIFVNQHQLTVLFGEYIPACSKCSFPSEFTISVTDYWNNPIHSTAKTRLA